MKRIGLPALLIGCLLLAFPIYAQYARFVPMSARDVQLLGGLFVCLAVVAIYLSRGTG